MSIRPTKEKLFFKKLNKEVMFNFITLEDEEWMDSKYENPFEFKSEDPKVLDKVLDLIWRFLDDDGKRLVRDVKLVKWDGFKETAVECADPIEKLKFIVSGADEAEAAVLAIINNRRKSNGSFVDVEKKSLKAESSSPIPSLSNSSPMPMDTPAMM